MNPAEYAAYRTSRIVAQVVSIAGGVAILAVTADRALCWLAGALVGAGVMRLCYLLDPSVGR